MSPGLSPPRTALGLDAHGYSSSVVERIVTATARFSSVRDATDAVQMAGIHIRQSQVRRLAHEVGAELIEGRDRKAIEPRRRQLPARAEVVPQEDLMARIKLRRYEAEEDDLPPVCIRCGEPSDVVRAKDFSWSPAWVYIFILTGLLPFLLVVLFVTKRMRVYAPLCAAHKNHWRGRALFTWGGFFGLLSVGAVALALGNTDGPPGVNNVGAEYMGFGVVAGLIVWLFASVILQSTAIRPAEITPSSITLVKVARVFAEAVKEERLRDEDDRDRRRRRDEDEDEDDGYDSPPPRRRRRDDDYE